MKALTTQEANILIKIAKAFLDPKKFKLADAGKTESYPLQEVFSKKRDLKMTMYSGRITSQKFTFQLMFRGNIILVRVDFGYPGTHINPDGSIIPPKTPHIHMYDEETLDKVALPLPETFSNPNDFVQVLYDFFSYVNIVNISDIRICTQGGLFDENDSG